MVQFGMLHHGQQKMENTKLIINTNLLLQGTPTSRLVVAQPMHRGGAVQPRPHRIGLAA
jgi:hypothetical protein